ncbi:MAG: Ig-like domain-containing protein, partial [Acidobacteriota bacterium]|nr:Ig-like domain-containing protein [Acidobacteriota bacterium]
YLYVVAGPGGSSLNELATYDISDPSHPTRVASVFDLAPPLAVTASTAYTTTFGTARGMFARDISVPSTFGSPIAWPGSVSPIAADAAIVAIGNGVSVRLLEQAKIVAEARVLADNDEGDAFHGIAMRNGLIAVATERGVVLTSAVDRLRWVRAVRDTPAWAVDFGDDMIVSVRRATGFAAVYQAIAPRMLQRRATFDFRSFGAAYLDVVALTDTLAVIGGRTNSGAGALFVGRYRTFTDQGSVSPVVSLSVAPPARTGKLLNLRASASDDVAVAAVTFAVNGTDVYTDAIFPYEFNYLVPASATTLTITARATDYAGNVTNSAPVELTPIP